MVQPNLTVVDGTNWYDIRDFDETPVEKYSLPNTIFTSKGISFVIARFKENAPRLYISVYHSRSVSLFVGMCLDGKSINDIYSILFRLLAISASYYINELPSAVHTQARPTDRSKRAVLWRGNRQDVFIAAETITRDIGNFELFCLCIICF